MSETWNAADSDVHAKHGAPNYPFAAGERLASKYELIDHLGAGGLGNVFAARHVGFDSQVALKFLHPEHTNDPELLACFKREARAGFQIDNKHVVRVIDLEELTDGTPFIVMEHLQGMDLQCLLDSSGKLPVQLACQYVLQVCAGLQAAHALGVIHRDIKPGNLFLVSADKARNVDPHIKLLDFGISKLCTGTRILQTASAPLHSTQVAIGTPQYMSPEQIRGASDLDTRTDIWSLGCVLYELLTGVSPFRRATIAQTCAAVLEDKPLSPVTLTPELPAGLVKLLLRCLDKDAKRRPQTVPQLATALAPFASGRLPLSAAELTHSVSRPVRVQRARLSVWTYAAAALFVLALLPSAWWATQPHAPRSIAHAKGRSNTLTASDPLQLEAAAAEPELLQAAAPPVQDGNNGSATKHRHRKLPSAPTALRPSRQSEPDVGF